MPGEAGREEERYKNNWSDISDTGCADSLPDHHIRGLSSSFKYTLWKAEMEIWGSSSNGNDGCASETFPCTCTFRFSTVTLSCQIFSYKDTV